MKPFLAILVIAAALITGCHTPYQKSGAMGGFTELRLDDATWRISFRGNGYTSAQRAEDYCLHRTCEVVLTNGFSHFIILTGANTVRRSSHTTPGYAYSSGTVSGSATGNQFYGSYNADTYYSPPQTHEIERPLSTLFIRAFHGQPPAEYGFGFDAALLRQQLRTQYKLP